MNFSMNKIVAFAVVISIVMSSCVSTKKYQELESKRKSCEADYGKLQGDFNKLKSSSDEQASLLAINKAKVDQLSKDTAELGQRYGSMQQAYALLDKNYNELVRQHQASLAGNEDETAKILKELKKTQLDLLKREDSLALLEKEYVAKKAALEQMSKDFSGAQSKLSENEIEFEKLKRELKLKDSIMNALRNSVAEALVGFEKEGLSVSMKNGRVYVSMEEKLLFPSGSFAVNPRGKEAIIKLAKVLETKTDISILVEGHTDTIPYKANASIDDNWDLSAKRATSIVRIIQQNSKINPTKVIASGRGEFVPIESNNTKEGRAKNRRTEIILMPDLDKIYQMVK